MFSFKARLMRAFMRNRHLMKGRLTPETIDKNTSIESLRKDTDEMAQKMFKPMEGVSFKAAENAPVNAEWAEPQGCNAQDLVLYFHGGGFVMGNALSHRGIVGNFVKHLGVKALTFDYRLAPENPAPAAAYDGAEVYQYVLGLGYRPEHIVFAGDSAGGGIALSTLLKLKDDGAPLPAACIAFSPCTDATLSGPSLKTRLGKDPCTPKGANETYLAYYVGNGDAKHPYASPLLGDLKGLPPIMIQVGDAETLLDDSVRFAKRAGEAGVEIRLHIWDGLFHCFPLLSPMFREATQAMEEVRTFVREKLAQASSCGFAVIAETITNGRPLIKKAE
jgi:acetyl esterase/lipase